MGATEEEFTFLQEQKMETEDLMSVLSLARETNSSVKEIVAQL